MGTSKEIKRVELERLAYLRQSEVWGRMNEKNRTEVVESSRGLWRILCKNRNFQRAHFF
jgi:hypothetical protein